MNMLFAPDEGTVSPVRSLPAAQAPTPEQDRIITDALFRERTVEVDPWVTFIGLAVPAVLTPLLYHRFLDLWIILGWELSLLVSMAWQGAMRSIYRKRYPYPHLPKHDRPWRLARHGFQAYVAVNVGLSIMFAFFANAIEWDIAAVAFLTMLFAILPNFAHERSEVLVSGLLLPLPVIAMLLMRDTTLHYSLAAFSVGIMALLTTWGMHQLSARRNEIMLRLALNEEKARAEQANIAKSKFLAAASHDLRQPLYALSLFVEALGMRIREDSDEQKLVHRIKNAVEAMQGLFNSLLDVSRLDAGTVVPVPGDFQLSPMLRRLDAEFSGQAHAAGLEWHCGCDECVVYSDPALVETILRNLISNAIRYTRRGSIRVTAETRAGQVRIEVRDTGVGIAPDRQQEVFDEFVQLHNPERDRTKGLGLGLAIVKRIAALLDHPLELESQEGVGSRFALTLSAGDPGKAAAMAGGETGAMQDPLKGTSVLVIDDEQEILDAMRVLLDRWECEVSTSQSVGHALDALEQSGQVPDLIISDLRLRGDRNGIDAIRAIRAKLGSNMPALIISGDTAPERLQQASAAGLPLLHKPVRPSKLRSAMSHLLRQKNGQQNSGNAE